MVGMPSNSIPQEAKDIKDGDLKDK